MIRIASLTIVLALLAGCGGGSPGTSSGAVTGPSANLLADRLGCTGDADTATNKVSCEFNDSYLGITSYKASSSRDADVAAGGGVVKVLVGDVWMIDAPDAATLEAAQEIVGGDIK